MPRLTVSLDDEQLEYIETVAEDRGRSKSWVVRNALTTVMNGGEDDGEQFTTIHHRLDDLQERVRVLEEGQSVALREGRQHAPSDAGDDGRDSSDVAEEKPRREPPVSSHENHDSESEDRPESRGSHTASDSPETSLSELLDPWPVDGAERVAEKRESALVALEWLRDRDRPASASDFESALYDEHGLDGQSGETWWRKTVRPALQHAQDAGLVEYRAGYHDYRWRE